MVMKPENILALLGHSVNCPEFERTIKFFRITERPAATLESWGGLSITGVSKPDLGIYFEFTTEMGYLNRFGKIKSRYTTEKYELILEHVTFLVGAPYPYDLPFDLLFDDDDKSIYKKIGSRPVSKSAPADNDCDIVFRFLTNNYSIIIRKGKAKIIFVKVFPIELGEIKSIEIKRSLSSQRKNISGVNKGKLVALKEHLPTLRWKQSMLDGDSCFSEKSIASSEAVFNLFIDNLIAASNKADASKIYSAVKKAINAFNKLQNNHCNFIESNEREQIIEFIEKAVKLTGFEIQDGLDLTKDIRQW